MSNLGDYQKITTIAKKVGGPKKLVLLIFGSGIIACKGGEVLFKSGKKLINRRLAEKKILELSVGQYEVKHNDVSNEGIVFTTGEHFRVLEVDGDSVLIERIGDINSPYFVSAELLKKISDYRN